MKIAMIGQKFLPSRAGGVEIHVEEISKRLVQRGHKVDVICRRKYCKKKTCLKKYTGSNCFYDGIQVICVKNIKSKSLDTITYSFVATLKAMFGDYDVIHFHALGPTTMSFLVRLTRKKIVCTVHGLDWQRDKWGGFATSFLKLGEYMSTKVPHHTITVGQKLVDYYKDKYDKDVIYIPNGINKPIVREAKLIKENYGIDKGEYLLFLARLVPEKNCHLLIEAYKELKTDKKLVIAGESSHTNKYQRSLHELAKGDERIVFTGFIGGALLDELYSNAYAYVLPSDIEGLPISLLEAMSYGNCCLVSDIRENMDVILDKGVSFKTASKNSLKEGIKYLIDNPEVVKKYERESAKFILDKYNWDEVVDETIAVYES